MTAPTLKECRLCISDGVDLKVKGVLIDGLFLHKTVEFTPTKQVVFKKTYTITHAPTGRAVISDISLQVASRLLDELRVLADWESITYPLSPSLAQRLKVEIKRLVQKSVLACAQNLEGPEQSS